MCVEPKLISYFKNCYFMVLCEFSMILSNILISGHCLSAANVYNTITTFPNCVFQVLVGWVPPSGHKLPSPEVVEETRPRRRHSLLQAGVYVAMFWIRIRSDSGSFWDFRIRICSMFQTLYIVYEITNKIMLKMNIFLLIKDPIKSGV